MTRSQWENIFARAIAELKAKAPKDTGNLAYNSIKGHWISETQYEIYVDMGDAGVDSPKVKGIAPYMPYTNEVWISPRWNGKKNPNEGWWNNAVEFIVKYIAKRVKGKVEK